MIDVPETTEVCRLQIKRLHRVTEIDDRTLALCRCPFPRPKHCLRGALVRRPRRPGKSVVAWLIDEIKGRNMGHKS